MSAKQDTEQETHEGGCLCGAVRYRIEGPIDSVTHCHCGMCRRASGAPVVTWITVPAERFTATNGELARYKSSENAERTFCPSCGAQITFWSTRHPDDIDVTLGTLDHPEQYPADRHIWTSSQIHWLHLDEHLPASPEFTSAPSAT